MCIPVCLLCCIPLIGQEIKLDIIGKDSLSSELLKLYQSKKRLNSQDELKESINDLIDTLEFQGYFDASIQRQKDTEKYVQKYFLHAGERTDIIYLTIDFNKIASKLSALGYIYIKDTIFPVPVVKLRSLFEQLVKMESNQGYPLAQFKMDRIRREDSKILADLTYTPGRARAIDSILLKGYTNFPKSHLKYYGRLTPGIPFNSERLLKASEALNDLPFVNVTREAAVLFTEDATSLYLYLEKKDANAFDGVLGFNTDPETNQLRFNGYLDLSLVNNFNFGESLNIKYRGDGNDQTNLNIELTAPYLLKSPVTAMARFNLFRRDSTFSTNRQSLRLQYQLSRKIALGISGTLENAESINDLGNATTLADYNKSRAGLTFSFFSKARTSVFDPADVLMAEAFFARRKTAMDNSDQSGFELSGGKNFELLPKFSIFLENSTVGLFSDTFFVNELYRIGGINSIRGFRENSIDANFASTLNANLKYAVSRDLLLQALADAAYFENEATAQDGVLYSLGLGTSLNTSGGIFSLILAKGFYPNATFTLTDLITHIQFSARF